MWPLMVLHTKSRMTPQCPLWVDAIVLCFVYFVRFVPKADMPQRGKKSAPAILASRVILDLNQSLSSLPLYRRHSEATANSRRER
jgi:hypothetical protein